MDEGGRRTKEAVDGLKALARPLAACGPDDLWRGQLDVELTLLESVQQMIGQADRKLDGLAAADGRVARLRTAPQAGNRPAELVVATLGDAGRFRSASQVGAYAGLVPRQYQGGRMNRLGRITGQGPGLLRRVLVQAAWGPRRRRGTRGHAASERLCHGQRTRREQAAVAPARKTLAWCWAILRDGTTWDDARGRGRSPAVS